MMSSNITNLAGLNKQLAKKVIKFMSDQRCSFGQACTALDASNTSQILLTIHQDDDLKQKLIDTQHKYEDSLFNKILEEAYTEPERMTNGCIDNGGVALKRVKIDALKWCLQTINPARYGSTSKASKPIAHNDNEQKQIEVIERIIIDAKDVNNANQ